MVGGWCVMLVWCVLCDVLVCVWCVMWCVVCGAGVLCGV